MYQGLGGGLLGGTNTYSPYSTSSLYSTMSTGSQGGLLGGGLGNGLGTGLGTGLGSGLGGGLGSGNRNLFSGGIRCAQNEDRLFQEKAQRNLLKKYLIQQTGDPIQSTLISNTIPGKGALDDFDVGLGTKNSIISKLGSSLFGNNPQAMTNQNSNILSTIGSLAGRNNGLLNSLAGPDNSNSGLLSSLVSLAGTPNNNGNILSSLGGLGTGLMGGNTNSGGLLGNIQSGIQTLNTINKVNNAVSGIKGIFA
jgi:hypothetical protein